MVQSTPLALHAAAWFCVGKSDDAEAPQHVPIKPPFVIGRNSDVDLSLPARSVSAVHAKIVEEDGSLWLHDFASTNGTFVNGQRVESKVRLSEGDTVQFAATVFQVTSDHPADNLGGINEDDPNQEALAQLQNIQFDRLFNGDVVPFFQPIVRIDQDHQTIYGYEILGRSRLFGLRTPAEMFAAASRLEMEAELSRVLRRQGIEVAAKGLPDHLALFVNTHPTELRCGGLVTSLREIRAAWPDRPITVEIHESSLNDIERASNFRSELTDLDIKLALDDFGSGHSRLAEVSEVSPDFLKFDTTLVQGIDKATQKRQHFLGALVRMVSELGITPLAECVEEKDEHQVLKDLGFKLGQGFFYGKPSSLPDCVEFASSAPQRKSPQMARQTGGREKPFSGNGSDPVEKDADWLLSQPGDHYTIQVLSAISREQAEQYIAQQERPTEFSTFAKQGKTRMLYIVLYGVFEDQAAAKTATSKLASSSVSPWIRMLSGVHAEIRTSR